MLNPKLASLVTIGIATKNRWSDLQLTLNKIIDFGLDLPLIIFDDASDIPCPFDIEALPFSNLHFQQFSTSAGYITRRNQIAQNIKTKYYLSLDDDSFPVLGSLQAVLEFAEAQEKLLGLSFPIYNPVQEKYENNSAQQQPYQVRSFIGCGHLLHCQKFLDLGGYCSELVHQGEEMELTARAFQQDLSCYHYPHFLIHHTASNQGRNWWRMDFYGSRNNVLWNDWFVPQRLKYFKQLKTLIARIMLFLQKKRFSILQGEIAGLIAIIKYRNNRHPMSSEYFDQWLSLPHS